MFSVAEEDDVLSSISQSVMGTKSTKMLSKLSERSCEEPVKVSKSKSREVLSPEAEDAKSEQKLVRPEKKSSFKMIPLIFLIGLAGLMLSSFPIF